MPIERQEKREMNEEIQAAYETMKGFGREELFGITQTETNPDVVEAAWLLIEEIDIKEK